MHYYTFNIGDYASHTKGLSLLEDLAYRRLLDEYYLAERPLNGCSTTVARLIGMRDQVAEVDYVLRSFFTQAEDGNWCNQRADREIQHFKDKSEKASMAGKASAQRRSSERSTDVEQPLNGRQLTNNQEPITNNQLKEVPTVLDDKPAASRPPASPNDQILEMYHKHLPMCPRVEVLNDGRKRAIGARWREVVTSKEIASAADPKLAALDFFDWYFEHASKSAFLTGRAKSWRADFDFLMTPAKFAKVVESHYHKDTV